MKLSLESIALYCSDQFCRGSISCRRPEAHGNSPLSGQTTKIANKTQFIGNNYMYIGFYFAKNLLDIYIVIVVYIISYILVFHGFLHRCSEREK